VQEKDKWWRDLDVGTREKTGTGRKERKEGAECATRRERRFRTCGMDVEKWEREEEKGTGRNTGCRRKGDGMDERNMEKEEQNGKRKGWGIDRKMFSFWHCYF
jgi:hypothetical protein